MEHALFKRVVGLPGDTVELRHEQLIINGSPVDYAPLAPTVSAQVADGERQASLFATEKLPGRDHAVMVTPHLPAKRDSGAIRAATAKLTRVQFEGAIIM